MGRVIGYSRLVKIVVNQHTSIHVDIIHARTTILFILNYNTFQVHFHFRLQVRGGCLQTGNGWVGRNVLWCLTCNCSNYVPGLPLIRLTNNSHYYSLAHKGQGLGYSYRHLPKQLEQRVKQYYISLGILVVSTIAIICKEINIFTPLLRLLGTAQYIVHLISRHDFKFGISGGLSKETWIPTPPNLPYATTATFHWHSPNCNWITWGSIILIPLRILEWHTSTTSDFKLLICIRVTGGIIQMKTFHGFLERFFIIEG